MMLADWKDFQLNIGRKRTRRENRRCRLIEAGPAYVHYQVKGIDIIFVDHNDGNGIGRLTGADYFHSEVPVQLYGELELEAEVIIFAIRRHIQEAKKRKKGHQESDTRQLRLPFI